MYRRQNEELSRDLVLSIQRILDLNASPETDPLDTVGDGFNAIDIINGYFPNGSPKFNIQNHDSHLPNALCSFSRGVTWATRRGSSAAG